MRTRSASSEASECACSPVSATSSPAPEQRIGEPDAKLARTSKWLRFLNGHTPLASRRVSFNDDVEDVSGSPDIEPPRPRYKGLFGALKVRGILRYLTQDYCAPGGDVCGPVAASGGEPPQGRCHIQAPPAAPRSLSCSPLTDLSDLPGPYAETLGKTSGYATHHAQEHVIEADPVASVPPSLLLAGSPLSEASSLPALTADSSSAPSSSDLTDVDMLPHRRVRTLRPAFSCPAIILEPSACASISDAGDLSDEEPIVSPLAGDALWNSCQQWLQLPRAAECADFAKNSDTSTTCPLLAPAAACDTTSHDLSTPSPKAPPLPLITPPLISELPPLPEGPLYYSDHPLVTPGRQTEERKRKNEAAAKRATEAARLRVDAAPRTAVSQDVEWLLPRQTPCARCRLEGVPCVARRGTRREGATCVLCSVDDFTANGCLPVRFGRDPSPEVPLGPAADHSARTRKRPANDDGGDRRPEKRPRTRAPRPPAVGPGRQSAPQARRSRSATPAARKASARQRAESLTAGRTPGVLAMREPSLAPEQRMKRSGACADTSDKVEEQRTKRRRIRR